MKNMILKIITSVIFIIWMILVFLFSHQPSIESKNTSSFITVKVVNLISEFKEISETEKDLAIKTLDPYIRKFAHYSLYTIGGVFSIIVLEQYKNLKRNKQVIISITIGILYAISDEIHQYFVPGRACHIKDVYLDSLGIVTGVILVLIIIKIYENIREYILRRGKTNEYYTAGRN